MGALSRILQSISGLGASGGQLAIAGGLAPARARSLELKVPRPRIFETVRNEKLDARLEEKFAQIREEERNILDKLIVLD